MSNAINNDTPVQGEGSEHPNSTELAPETQQPTAISDSTPAIIGLYGAPGELYLLTEMEEILDER